MPSTCLLTIFNLLALLKSSAIFKEFFDEVFAAKAGELFFDLVVIFSFVPEEEEVLLL